VSWWGGSKEVTANAHQLFTLLKNLLLVGKFSSKRKKNLKRESPRLEKIKDKKLNHEFL